MTSPAGIPRNWTGAPTDNPRNDSLKRATNGLISFWDGASAVFRSLNSVKAVPGATSAAGTRPRIFYLD